VCWHGSFFVCLPGFPYWLSTNRNDRWIFVFGFEKSERENISENEQESLKKLAKDLLCLTADQIEVAISEGSLMEVEHEA
jgi:hypothetical protein